MSWQTLPESLRSELTEEVKMALQAADYEGLNSPYDDQALGVAMYIAYRVLEFAEQ